jgi:hypothetical protein
MVRRLLCPDPEVLWVPFALRKARRIIREHGIEFLLVTAPPFSAFLVGNALKREFPELKMITDFRDSWLEFYAGMFDFQRSEYTRRRSREIELETVQCSDFVITVTHSILKELRTRYPEQPGGSTGFLVCRAFTGYTSKPRSSKISYNGIQYTPVDCIATVSTPHACNQSAKRCKSAVKHSNRRTGSRSWSGRTAT